jgi:hypothetical protein
MNAYMQIDSSILSGANRKYFYMSTKQRIILEWGKRVLRFGSEADAELFAANGALFMESSAPDSTETHYIVAEDNQFGVHFLNITNATGEFTFENLKAWLTGTVGDGGIAATMTALSAPPKTRTGRPIAHVRSVAYRKYRQRNGWVYLDLRDAGVDSSELLRTLSYEQYLRTDHWLKVRDAAIKRANFRCALCNSGVNLHAHHRTYERLGRELPADLTVLCSACHDKFHQSLPAPPEHEKGS